MSASHASSLSRSSALPAAMVQPRRGSLDIARTRAGGGERDLGSPQTSPVSASSQPGRKGTFRAMSSIPSEVSLQSAEASSAAEVHGGLYRVGQFERELKAEQNSRTPRGHAPRKGQASAPLEQVQSARFKQQARVSKRRPHPRSVLPLPASIRASSA